MFFSVAINFRKKVAKTVNIAFLSTTVEDGFCVPDCTITSTGTNLVLESRMRNRFLSGNQETVVGSRN